MNTSLSLNENATALCHLLGATLVTTQAGELPQEQGWARAREQIQHCRRTHCRIFLIGNGGSAAVASHTANDLLKRTGAKALTLHDPATLTCLANDFGYEQALAHAVTTVASPGDLLIAISSSGRSPNIRNAATAMHQLGGKVITLSGFDPDNPLRCQGNLNIWVPSHDYGLVEIAHQFVLHYLAETAADFPDPQTTQDR